MFELTVEREFCAAHALRFADSLEPLHGHNFRLRVTVAGSQLDHAGMLVDFHALERLIDDILQPFRNGNLNDLPPFDRLSPSAERIAQHIGQRVAEGLERSLPRLSGVRLHTVSLTEAPGCVATYVHSGDLPHARAKP